MGNGNASLEKIKNEIVSHITKENILVFYGLDVTGAKIPSSEIHWQRRGDWKGFIQVAKSEGVKTLILQEQVLQAEDVSLEFMESRLEGQEELNEELQKQIKKFSKYIGKIGELEISWIKDGVKYTFSERSQWYGDFESMFGVHLNRSTAIGRLGISRVPSTFTQPLPEELKNKSAEDLADELIEFIKKEFPEGGTRASYVAKELFWNRKGIRHFEADPETRLLMEKVGFLIDKRLREQQIQDEKEKLPDLIEPCIEWAKEYNLNKLAKANLRAFLAERGETLSRATEDILLQQVNFRLKQE